MNDLEQRALDLEKLAQQASASERLSIAPQFEAVLNRMSARGYRVPSRLRSLNNTLKEEAIEDMFDNLPV